MNIKGVIFMIRINIRNIEEIVDWYLESVLPIVKNRKVTYSPGDDFENNICNDLNSISFCSDVISLSVDELQLRYDWVRIYKQSIDFCVFSKELYNIMSQIKGCGMRSKRSSLMREYFIRYNNPLIQDLLEQHIKNIKNNDDRINKLTSTKKSLEKFVTIVKKRIDNLNNIIIQKFNYDSVLGDSEIRGLLVNKLGIKVCPYCNRQYINSVTYEKMYKYLGDIDHILPKSKYALFQLSFYNMIPVCKVCNQLFKKDKMLHLLNPYFEGFDDDAYLKINYSSVRELIGLEEPNDFLWEINEMRALKHKIDCCEEEGLFFLDKFSKIKNSINLFKLNEVYKTNAIEFQRILRLKYINESQLYRKQIDDILGNGSNSILNNFDERLVYGVSFDDNYFQDEILSKAIYDIVVRN